MPRGKNTNVHLFCTVCREAGKARPIYTTKLNKQALASMGKPAVLTKKKYCPVCNAHTEHGSKDIKKGGTKALANAK